VTALPAYPPIAEIVPHRPPMLLLDRVVSYDGERVVCELLLKPDSPFAQTGEDGGEDGAVVPAIVGLEYMAQTIAAGAGLSARGKGQPARMGFLLGCRGLNIAVDSFRVGDHLSIEAVRRWGENDLGSFACTVRRGDEVLVEGTLTVYQGALPPEEAAR
jgi:predicted hotdog family 3-hydroxylacyl-ACP dehydratase